MLDLPYIQNWTAQIISENFGEVEIGEAIAYLGLVLRGRIRPGLELERLGIDLQQYNNMEFISAQAELLAVQNKLALAIYKIRNSGE